MEEQIKKAVKQAEEIVKASEVSSEFAALAYESVLNYLLQSDNCASGTPMRDTQPPAQRKESASSSGWSSLVKDKEPKNAYQLIALAVFYLGGKKSEEKQDESFVSKEELEDFLEKKSFTHIEDKDLDNLSSRINATISIYQYIKSEKRGLYALSPRGRKVVHNLPNQPKEKS